MGQSFCSFCEAHACSLPSLLLKNRRKPAELFREKRAAGLVAWWMLQVRVEVN